MRTLLAALLLSAVPLHAEEAPVPPQRAYLLVSAVGSTLQFVRSRFTTGTNLPGYIRADVAMPDKTLDAAALRGLEKIIRATDPSARVEYLRLNPEELREVEGTQRGPVAAGKVATALSRMPDRERFHQILVLTPRYVPNERAGMASKLQGIGIYLQGIDRHRPSGVDPLGDSDDEVESITPSGEPAQGRGSQFYAPFFYAQVWVLEPRTLEVLNTSERFDFVRVRDPDSRALRIENAIPPEKLGPIVESFVERAAEKAAREAIGVVTVGEPRVVKPH